MTQMELNRTAKMMAVMVGREWAAKALHESVENGTATEDMVKEALLAISGIDDDPVLREPLTAIANLLK